MTAPTYTNLWNLGMAAGLLLGLGSAAQAQAPAAQASAPATCLGRGFLPAPAPCKSVQLRRVRPPRA